MDNQDEQLDRLMAKKVMGWELRFGNIGNRMNWQYWHDGDCALMAFGKWQPTKDMNQAMMCAEKLVDDTVIKWFKLEVGYEGSEKYYNAIVHHYDTEGTLTILNSYKSAPLAICQAIKEALDA